LGIEYHTVRSKITTAAAIVGFFTFLSQIGGFAKEYDFKITGLDYSEQGCILSKKSCKMKMFQVK
jgi:hypothetical protein